jgi:hypothetical protein
LLYEKKRNIWRTIRGSDSGCGAFATGALVGERVRKEETVRDGLGKERQGQAEDRVLQGGSFSF